MSMKALTPLFLLLLFSSLVVPTLASNVDIDVVTDDDLNATVSLEGGNVTASVTINGFDVLKEEYLLHEAFQNVLIAGWYEHEAFDRIDELQERHEALVLELNQYLADLYWKLGFTWRALGVTSNSSSVVVNLRAGNVTVADYLEQLIARAEKTEAELDAVEEEMVLAISKLDASTRASFVELKQYVDKGLQSTQSYVDAKDIALETRVGLLEAEVTQLANELHQSETITTNLMYMFFGTFVVILLAIVLTRSPKVVVPKAIIPD